MTPAKLIRTPDEVTTTWLAAALGRPDLELVGTERIGTGQMSQSHRVRFLAEDGRSSSVVVKLASESPASRGTGVGMGAYFREVGFYRELAGRIGGAVPACHLAEYDEQDGWFTLVLDDIAGATQGDQISGCGPDEAGAALLALAGVHAPVIGDLALGTAPFLNQPNPLTQELLTALLPGFLERYGDRIAPEHADVCRRFVPVSDGWGSQQSPPLGLIHGDFRLDNLLFGDGTCTVVDWQTVSWGPVMVDASYFLGGALTVEDRRIHEEDLIRLYHGELLAHGVTGLTFEQAWEGYRLATFHGIVMTIAASMVVERTDRGDDMFMSWLARNAQQVLDLDALALLPQPDAGTPQPLRPDPADEGRHEQGPEPMWNESWYFDAVSDDGQIGVYTRVGRLPNQDQCLSTTCITGPGRPSIMLVGSFPLPDPDDPAQVVTGPGLRAEHHCEVPLERFRVTIAGIAQTFDDASAPLRAETGEEVEIAFDLTWVTDGIPFAWRQATRYEIPCQVSGSVTVGGEEVAFSGPGQRDHSWGSRDWWAVDWMWNGLHLEDGTHIHQVGVPQLPGYGVGYVQQGDVITEITSVDTTTEIAPNGLVTSARITSGPDAPTLDIEPVAFGAIRLDAPDGRLSLFPRAMCRVRTDDGRRGSGWIEWNLVQRPDDAL